MYESSSVLTAFGDAESFEIQTFPKPVPKPKQVLVRVCATSINPVDSPTRRGDYKDLVRLPAIKLAVVIIKIWFACQQSSELTFQGLFGSPASNHRS